MTEKQPPYNLRTLRQLMISAFSAQELRALVGYDEKLKEVARVFAPTDAITELVDKAIQWCERRELIPYLVQRIKEERPDAHKRYEAELFVGGAGEPQAGEPAAFSPEILTITSPIHLNLVKVPAGEFLMGSVKARDKHARDDELPPHRVYVPEFWIGQYPVTNLQYQAFVKATHRKAPAHWKSGEIPSGEGNHPVIQVLWSDALEFCVWLVEETGRPFRLPTEAEWEKAARGTDGRIYPWGDEPPEEWRCNYHHRGWGVFRGKTKPVGSYSPHGDSPYGCADMAGNVWDWTWSTPGEYPYNPLDGRENLDLRDYRGLGPVRVIRGGSFEDSQRDVRSAYRSWLPLFLLGPFDCVGFRVALAPVPSDSFGTAQDGL